MLKFYKIFILANSIYSSSAFCPDKCICDDDNLETSCIETNLEVKYTYSDILLIYHFFR